MNGAVTLSRRRSVLGVRVGVFIGWQIVAVAAVLAVTQHGPLSWALGGVALAGCVLTMLRWRHRWAFEWLVAAFAHRGRAAGRLPAVDVCPARLRSGTEAGVAHDGSGFSVIVAIGAQPAGPPVTELPAEVLAGLLDGQDALVSAVQLVLHSEFPADGPAGPPTAYQNLGYGVVPRSSSAWLALRHDPAQSRYVAGSAGSARDVRTSLLRGLAGRGSRAVDVLSGARLTGRVLDVPAVRELLTSALLVSGDDAPAARWDAWLSSSEQHVTYWVRRWPAGGI